LPLRSLLSLFPLREDFFCSGGILGSVHAGTSGPCFNDVDLGSMLECAKLLELLRIFERGLFPLHKIEEKPAAISIDAKVA
jgi:hypothetical protein